MTNRYSDDELGGMLPDYLNNNLDPESRQEVERYIARNGQAATELENLRLILDELHRQEISAPGVLAPGLNGFLAHAKAHPLRRKEIKPASWLTRLAALTTSWGQPAFAIALLVIVGQSVIIANLSTTGSDRDAPALTRSLTQDIATGRKRGPVLNIEVAREASVADLMAVVREIDGTIVFGNGEGNILYVELASLSPKDAAARLKQSKLILSVIEIPPLEPRR
jgi:anti-sigma factor RsiW